MDEKSRFDNRPTKTSQWLTAQQVMGALDVKRATVYTYASRGWLASIDRPSGRGKLYSADDVHRLSQRAQARSGHAPVASAAMRWGEPIVETTVSTVRDGVLIYRGVTLEALLHQGASFESVCELLWDSGESSAQWSPRQPSTDAASPEQQPGSPALFIGDWIVRLQGMADDAGARGLVPTRRQSTRLARQVIRELAEVPSQRRLSNNHTPNDGKLEAKSDGVSGSQVQRGGPTKGSESALAPQHQDLLHGALICCADHELNASTFAARVASATGAGLHHCLIAALATFSGPRHGSASLRVEALLDQVQRGEDVDAIIGGHLRRGEALPGLGHPLYPDGDPRARWMLRNARKVAEGGTSSRDLDAALLLVDGAEALGCPPPNLDVGLVALAAALGMQRGSARRLFATGRLAGWCAHVMEQRELPGLLRPRARYVGP